MKIYGRSGDDIWNEAGIDRCTAPIISVVGGGGKTSLIKNMSDCLNQQHIQHFVATTTHMWPMDFGDYGCRIGMIGSDGKLQPPTEEEWKSIFSKRIPVLIEADGSKGLPLKAPEEWEPVLRKETTHVFAVLGASGLGKKVSEICHRPEKVMNVLKCSKDHYITKQDFVRLATDDRGLKKNVKSRWKYYVVINQVDSNDRYENMSDLEKDMSEKGVEKTFFTFMKR